MESVEPRTSVSPERSSVEAVRAPGAPAQPPRRSVWRLLQRPEFGAFAGGVLVYAFFAFTGGGNGFLSESGTASWMNTSSELGVLAIPIGMLMIAGEFDLSVGSIIGATSMTVAVCDTVYNWPLWAAIALSTVIGAIIGLINGLLTVRTGLPSFIVTLAGLFMVAGAALGLSYLLAGTTSVSLTPSGSAQAVFGSQWQGFHVSIIWWVVVAAIASWILTQTPFGNWIFATGGQRESARAAGVPTNLVKVCLFVATAVGAVLVGVIQTVTYNNGNVTYGRDFVFDAPLASVVGGVLLSGGYGSAIGVFIGTVIFGVVNLGVFYTGWHSEWAQLLLGALLLAAVLGNNYFRRLAMSAR